MDKTIRLQVALSRSGVASRRKAVNIIEEGRVSVNDRIIRQRGCHVNPDEDKILVDGKRIRFRKKIYILMNKPKGVISSRYDPQAGKTIFDILPQEFRELHPVGRLDKSTRGLLLLTNDGELTYKLTHPRFEVLKKYRATCRGKITQKEKNRLEKGMVIDGKRTAQAKVEIISANNDASELFIEIHEGRKRQIRNMFLYLGHPVKKLERIGYEFLQLGFLKRGKFRYLTDNEVKRLKEL